MHGCNNDKNRALAREGAEDLDNTPWLFLTFAVLVALEISDCISALPTDVPNLKGSEYSNVNINKRNHILSTNIRIAKLQYQKLLTFLVFDPMRSA